MDITVFSDICEYLNMKSKGQKKLSNEQKDKIAKAKIDRWWEKQDG